MKLQETFQMKQCLLGGGLLLIAISLSACNFFDVVSSPSGDEQLLSAARACLDRGDAACALENYQKLSDTYKDIRLSETAFSTLDKEGITIGTLFEALGKGSSSGGVILTRFSNEIAKLTIGESKRTTILGAYKSAASIVQADLKAFTRFLTSLALTGELLAEYAGANQEVEKTDFITNSTACLTAFTASAAACAASCTAASGLTAGTEITDMDAATLTGSVTLAMVKAAINALATAMQQFNANGKFASGTLSFAQDITSSSNPLFSPSNGSFVQCFSTLLISQNIGSTQ